MSARLAHPLRNSSADREVDALVPGLRRAKALRFAASALDLARAEPIPDRLTLLSSSERKEAGLEMFERSGLSKRGYHRETGHKCWNHVYELVTPGTSRVFTAFDLWVLEKLLVVLGAVKPVAKVAAVTPPAGTTK